MNRTAVGTKLKELRLGQGLSLRGAARRLAISPSRLSDYEEGRTHSTNRPAVPGPEFIKRAAALYQYPGPALLGLAGYLAESPATYYASDLEADLAEIADVYERLPDTQRAHMLEIVRSFKRHALVSPITGTNPAS